MNYSFIGEKLRGLIRLLKIRLERSWNKSGTSLEIENKIS